MSKTASKIAPVQKVSWKDYLSIIISIVALTISAVGSYFTFFREETAVRAAVMGVSLGDNETEVNVVVMNTGNRHVALTGGQIYLLQNDGSEVLRQPMRALPVTTDKAMFPALIEPGKMIIFNLKAESNWEGILAYRHEIEPGDDHSHETVLGVELDALGATGVRLEGLLDAVTIELRGNEFGGRSIKEEVVPFKRLKPR